MKGGNTSGTGMRGGKIALIMTSFLFGVMVSRMNSHSEQCLQAKMAVKEEVKKPGCPPAESPKLVPSPRGPLPIEQYDLEYLPLTLKGHQYFVPKSALHRPAAKSFIQGNYFEQYTHDSVKALLKEFPGSMVHAGTFFGDMVPHFASIVKETSGEAGHMLYAFEPNTKNYLLAQKAVDANKLDNVVLMNAALGPKVAQVKLATHKGSTDEGGASSVQLLGNQRVPQVAIDMLNIKGLSILQLDVEGFEYHALLGALETIRREKPILAVEDQKGAVKGMLKDELSELGYKTMCKKQNNIALVWYATPENFDRVKELVDENKGCPR